MHLIAECLLVGTNASKLVIIWLYLTDDDKLGPVYLWKHCICTHGLLRVGRWRETIKTICYD